MRHNSSDGILEVLVGIILVVASVGLCMHSCDAQAGDGPPAPVRVDREAKTITFDEAGAREIKICFEQAKLFELDRRLCTELDTTIQNALTEAHQVALQAASDAAQAEAMLLESNKRAQDAEKRLNRSRIMLYVAVGVIGVLGAAVAILEVQK